MMPNLFKIETRLIEVEAARSALEELVDARPTPANGPVAWANRHLSRAVVDLRQEVDDQTRGVREARTGRRSLDGMTLIVKQTLSGWGNRLRTWPARN